ncbi:putative GTP cyclohydrolase 1 type 2 [Grifola frondosa]|uniref:ATP phosphoribosyltransferase n=1 Tax=Grifola frondosa TaxID=5627 RepID=A0A1C7M3G4_GRIFR|nr:putative GTP cyclohydrolase 1 type 2 [Grifola frondosa]
MMQRFKLVFFAPVSATQPVLQHLFTTFPQHVGRIGAYGGCAFVSRGTGQFTPQAGAQPAIGTVGVPERVEEDRVEVLVRGEVRRVLEELKKIHPYEEVAYDVYRLEEL